MSWFATAAVPFFQNLTKPADNLHGCRGVTRWCIIPRAPNHYGERRMTAGAPKSPNNVTSTFFNTVLLIPKDLKFEHGGAKLASCPGRCQTSSRPCTVVCHAPVIRCEYPHHTGEACFETPTVKPALSSKYMVGKAALYFQNHFKNWSKFIRAFSFKSATGSFDETILFTVVVSTSRSSLIFLVVELAKA